jgi:hypothetical protein
MENQEKKNVPRGNNDVDLGMILSLIGRGFDKMGRLIRQFFVGVTNGILFALIFLKKRIWWIIGAILLGYGWGTYQSYESGVKYRSTMTARFNFGSAKALYNTTIYLNNLISQGRRDELSKLLSISGAEAATLRGFEVEPVNNEKQVSELYKQQFFDYNRANLYLRTDTFWTRVLPYRDFKNSLAQFDFPVQEITAVSTMPDVFPRLQQGIINAVVSNGDLQKDLEIQRKTQADEEAIIISSLNGLDTLRAVYNERLRKQGAVNAPNSSISLQDKAIVQPNPEIQLYDKVMQLKDELKLVREHKINNRDLVQVYVAFSQVGQRSDILEQGGITYALLAVTLLFLVFLAFELYRVISYYEKKQKTE